MYHDANMAVASRMRVKGAPLAWYISFILSNGAVEDRDNTPAAAPAAKGSHNKNTV